MVLFRFLLLHLLLYHFLALNGGCGREKGGNGESGIGDGVYVCA